MAKTTKLQSIYCPWCHAPLVFVGTMRLNFDADEQRDADRYDCGGPATHTILVMLRLEN
jgi:RNase P subunit RPR2